MRSILNIVSACALIHCSVASSRADDMQDKLHALAAQYQWLTSVNMRAECLSVNNDSQLDPKSPDHVEFETIYTYHASGNFYGMTTDSDPTVVKNFRFRIAYDGNTYQAINLITHSMSITVKEADDWPVLFPNPFYLPITFVAKVNQYQIFAPINLKEAKDSDTFDKLFSQATRGKETNEIVAEFPLGTLNKLPYLARVHFPAEGYMPTRVERLFAGGEHIDEAFFEKYEQASLDGHPFFYPVQIHRLQYSGKDNQVYSDMHQTITHCTLNKTINPAVFTIDYNTATRVIDRDSGEIVKDTDRQIREESIAKLASQVQAADDASNNRQNRALAVSTENDRNLLYRWMGLAAILLLIMLVMIFTAWQKKRST